MNAINTRPDSAPNRTLLAGLLIFFVFVLNVYRALNQSITHDEALSYNAFASQNWRTIFFSFNSNNHVLHSALMRISTTLLGLSHLSVRLPALIGGLLYMAAMERICRDFFIQRNTYLLVLSASILSPFVLDYLVIARGYSLALGFLMLAFLIGRRIIVSVSKQEEISNSQAILFSTLCGLSVAANLAFAFPATALLILLLTQIIWTSQRINFWKSTLKILLPAGLVQIILNPAIFKFNSQTLYFGADNWAASIRSISKAVFGGYDFGRFAQFNTPTSEWLLRSFPFLFALIGLLGGVLILISVLSKGRDRVSDDWIFVFSLLSLTITLSTIAFYLFGALYPFERTGIYFVPLFVLLLGMSYEAIAGNGWRKILHWFATATIFITILVFIVNTRIQSFRGREYDAGSQEIYSMLRTLDIKKNTKIGINWLMEPSLNFYRNLFGDSFMPRFTRSAPSGEEEYYVLLPLHSKEDRQFISANEVFTVFEDSISQAIIGKANN
jgi:hypothetical protein